MLGSLPSLESSNPAPVQIVGLRSRLASQEGLVNAQTIGFVVEEAEPQQKKSCC